MPISGTPVEEKCALVKLPRKLSRVIKSDVGYLISALPLLNLPPCHVHIQQKVPVGQQQRGSRPDSNHATAGSLGHVAGLDQLRRIEEFLEITRLHKPKYRVVAEKRREFGLNSLCRQHRAAAFHHKFWRQPQHKFPLQRLEEHSRVALYCDPARRRMGAKSIEYLAPTRSAFRFGLRNPYRRALVVI